MLSRWCARKTTTIVFLSIKQCNVQIPKIFQILAKPLKHITAVVRAARNQTIAMISRALPDC